MLTLPIKQPWYGMYLRGEKEEEYRELNEYYETRFISVFGIRWVTMLRVNMNVEGYHGPTGRIRFRNGYRKDSPSFVAECTLRIGEGRQEWGAVPGKRYFILVRQKILEIS